MKNFWVADKFGGKVVAAPNAPRAFKSVYGMWPFDVTRASQAGYERNGEQETFRCYIEPHRVTIWFGSEAGGDYVMVGETGDSPT